jgi:hypothetical protein
MFTLISRIVSRFAENKAPHNELDRYITSKNPSSPAEVDHWAKEYTRKANQGWFI